MGSLPLRGCCTRGVFWRPLSLSATLYNHPLRARPQCPGRPNRIPCYFYLYLCDQPSLFPPVYVNLKNIRRVTIPELLVKRRRHKSQGMFSCGVGGFGLFIIWNIECRIKNFEQQKFLKAVGNLFHFDILQFDILRFCGSYS